MAHRLCVSFETPTFEEWDFLTDAAIEIVGRRCDWAGTSLGTTPPVRDMDWGFAERAEAEAAAARLQHSGLPLVFCRIEREEE